MGTELTDRLDSDLGDLLGVDPDTLTNDELHELVVASQRQSHRHAAARAKLISAWDARAVWADDGSRSAAHRLARETSMAVGSAKVEIRRARQLRTMPHTNAALGSGSLSPDHVDLLARANDGARTGLFAEHEATLVEQCQLLRFPDACRMVDYWRQRADAAGCEDEAERIRSRRTHRRPRRWTAPSTCAPCSTRSVALPSRPSSTGSSASCISPTRGAAWCARSHSAAPTPWSRWPTAPAPQHRAVSGPDR